MSDRKHICHCLEANDGWCPKHGSITREPDELLHDAKMMEAEMKKEQEYGLTFLGQLKEVLPEGDEAVEDETATLRAENAQLKAENAQLEESNNQLARERSPLLQYSGTEPIDIDALARDYARLRERIAGIYEAARIYGDDIDPDEPECDVEFANQSNELARLREVAGELRDALDDYCSLRNSECTAIRDRKRAGGEFEGAAFFSGKAGAFREVAVELKAILARAKEVIDG